MIYQNKIIALDVGDKRIGIAFSDMMRITAQGYETYQRIDETKDIAHIKELCAKFKVESIVCGLPKNMNGTIGPQAEKVCEFADKLKEACGLPLEYYDERLTTVLAEKMLIDADVSRKKRRGVIDKLAAVTILQSYLDSIKYKVR